MIPEPKLENLYQEVILDHNRRPRNFKEMADATQYSHGVNALCGDNYQLYLKITPATQVIEEVAFQGAGCAISKSSASLMTTLIKGKTIHEVQELRQHFLDLMTKDDAAVTDVQVGRMMVFKGVRDFPVRVKCATLIWHALADALKDVKE